MSLIARQSAAEAAQQPISVTELKSYISMTVIPSEKTGGKLRRGHKNELIRTVDGGHRNCRLPLSSLVKEPYYQDNTECFEYLLESYNRQVIQFPTGSGKTMLGMLFYEYVAKNVNHERTVTEYLATCNFKTLYPDIFYEHLHSHEALYMSYAEFDKPVDYDDFEQKMIEFTRCLFPEFDTNNGHDINTYIGDRVAAMAATSGKLRAIVIVDSIDTAFNSIAGLPDTVFDRCYRLLRNSVNFMNTAANVIFLGVSSYLLQFKFVLGHDSSRGITRDTNEPDFHHVFSLSEATIKTAIEKLELETSVQEVKDHSVMQCHEKVFINPMLATQYLRSVNDRETTQWPLRPRSLWFTAIFRPEDITFLRDVLLGKEIYVGPSLDYSYEDVRRACTNQNVPNKSLLRSLFTCGGYFSVIEELRDGKSVNRLFMSNITTRLMLSAVLESIEMHKRGLISPHILNAFRTEDYQLICDVLYDYLQPVCCFCYNNEDDYTYFLHGALNGLSAFNNAVLGGTKPDLKITQPGLKTFIEIKLLKRPEWTTGLTLDVFKNPVFNIKQREAFATEMKLAKANITKKLMHWRPTDTDIGENELVNLIGIVFAKNMVLLHHSKYNFTTMTFDEYTEYSSHRFLAPVPSTTKKTGKTTRKIPQADKGITKQQRKRK